MLVVFAMDFPSLKERPENSFCHKHFRNGYLKCDDAITFNIE